MGNHNKSLQKKQRIEYLDYLRVLATFSVMLLHVAAGGLISVGIDTFQWKVFLYYDSSVRWAVPVFVMISGTVFLGGSPKSIDKIYKRYILRIITSFCFWSAIYTAIYIGQNDAGVKDGISIFLKGSGHMWFLFMIVGLYLLIPLLRKITESEVLVKYFLVLSLVFTFGFPYFLLFFSMKYDGLGAVVRSMLDNMNFHFTLGYVSYFVAGFYLNQKEIHGRLKWLIYLLGVLGFLGTALLTEWVSQSVAELDETFFDKFTINVMLESVAVFVFAKNYYDKHKVGGRIKKILGNLAKYSFGAYLVHVMVKGQLDRMFNLNALSFGPIVAVPLVAIIVFAISFGISAVLNHIPVLNKYIV